MCVLQTSSIVGISSLASISWLEEDTACLSTTREKRNVKKAMLLLYWGTISQAVPPNYLVLLRIVQSADTSDMKFCMMNSKYYAVSFATN